MLVPPQVRFFPDWLPRPCCAGLLATQDLPPMDLNTLDIEDRPSDTRVVVAMSGGVDSSVTAALLAEAGYDVVGITLQLYDHGAATHRKGACCAGRHIHDARAMVARIRTPPYVLHCQPRCEAAE